MIFTDTEIIRLIKQNSKEPDDLKHESIAINKDPVKPLLFTAFEGKEALAYKTRQLNSFTTAGKRIVAKHEYANTKSSKFNNDDMWDVDVKSSSGVFDSQGQFISTTENKDPRKGIKKDNKNDTLINEIPDKFLNYDNFIENDEVEEIFWLIKSVSENKPKIEGPFSTDEIKSLDLAGKFIKRTIDKKFVEIDKVQISDNFFENFDSERINEEIKNKEGSKEEIDQALKELKITDNSDCVKKLKEDTVEDNKDWHLNCEKTLKLLKRRKCDLDLLTIEKEIKGLTKKDAKVKLSKISNLSEIDSLDVLNLLVSEAKKVILSDVDKDGFMKN
ncbi:hypothetical protein DMUE_0828 [Dictyocoela muelleri]|nr:hypothetical protein DMUE_0828 [Dictyocoela muelleri]